MKIIHFEADEIGNLSEDKSFTIIFNDGVTKKDSFTDNQREIFKHLKDDRSIELEYLAKKVYQSEVKNQQITKIKNIILQAELLGVVKIEDKDKDDRIWRVTLENQI